MKTGPGVKQTLLAQYSRSRDKEKQSLTCELRQQFSKQQNACGSRITSGGEWVGAVRDGDWRQMPGGNRRCWHPSGVTGLGWLVGGAHCIGIGQSREALHFGMRGSLKASTEPLTQYLWWQRPGGFFCRRGKRGGPYCESEISVFKYNLCSSSESFTIQASHSSPEKQLLITPTH